MKQTKYLFDESKMTPEGMVSVSQLQTFLSCKRKWQYNYIENLKPRVERSYLTIGKLCHKGMQTAMIMRWQYGLASLEQLTEAGIKAMIEEYDEYMKNTPILDEELLQFEQLWEDARNVFTQALREFDPIKYEVIQLEDKRTLVPALELHFVVPCKGSKGLHGYIDAILKDRETGFIWCVDYKFRKSIAPDEDEAFNIQNAVYSYACKKLGINITGTMTWQHLNTPPADPQVLKTGAVSRAKIKTTWEHYAACCRGVGENPDYYEDEMKEKLSDIEWYRATLEYRNDETIQRIWEECVMPVAREIKSAHSPKANNYRSLYPWNCMYSCPYKQLCQAELRGYDVEAIIDREYIKR